MNSQQNLIARQRVAPEALQDAEFGVRTANEQPTEGPPPALVKGKAAVGVR